MGDRWCGNARGSSRRTRRSHRASASTDGAGCCGSAACSAMGDRWLWQRGRPIAAHAPLPQGFCKQRRCRLLWERCVQRDGRSVLRQRVRPIAAHAPLPQGFCKHRRCRLLWERCVQRDGRSVLRQRGRPIAAHAPLPRGFCKHRRCRLLWERCVQRDGRSLLRQSGRLIAAHAPFPLAFWRALRGVAQGSLRAGARLRRARWVRSAGGGSVAPARSARCRYRN
jgi:hypothetical protein